MSPILAVISRPCFAVQLLLLLTPGVRGIVGSTYQLEVEYSGKKFFDGFDFFTEPDPTHGFVTYVDRSTASSLSLISSSANGASYMGVDASSVLNPTGPGRKSVRLTSKKSFTHGLFIADIAHMPGGICGTWPAYWMFGPEWPTSGEIDIIEGVNSQQGNIMSLHSSQGCTVAGDLQSGTLQTPDCDAKVNYNSGCGVTSHTKASYGSEFNAANGGVFATQWTSDYIRIWFFPQGSIPSDIKSGKPNPSGWGKPEANFQDGCNFDKYFKNHNIIFDTTFCGDWGNALWGADDVCKTKATTCNEFVAENPKAFKEASWSINYLKVYQLEASAAIDINLAIDSTTTSINTNTTTVQIALATPPSALIHQGESHSSKLPKCPPYPVFKSNGTAQFRLRGPNKEYIGCLAASSIINAATTHQTDDYNTVDQCVASCASSSYAGVWYKNCYCLDQILDQEDIDDQEKKCDINCPGNPKATCGGLEAEIESTLKELAAQEDAIEIDVVEERNWNWRRQAELPGMYLSVYEILGNFTKVAPSCTTELEEESASTSVDSSMETGVSETDKSADHYHDESDELDGPLTSVAPASQTFAYGMGGGADDSQYYTKVITTTYIDVCGCHANTLKTYTITSTVSHCACVHPNPFVPTLEPVIPHYTTEKSCVSCGPAGTVTVTIPYLKATTTEEVITEIQTQTVYPVKALWTGNATSTGFTRANATAEPTHYQPANEGDGKGKLRWGVGFIVSLCAFVFAVL